MLDTLRKKSENTRIVITVVAALVITIAITAFWLWSISGRFSQAREETPETTKPFAVLGSIFSEVTQDIKSLRETREASLEQPSESSLQKPINSAPLVEEYVDTNETTSIQSEEQDGMTIYTTQ